MPGTSFRLISMSGDAALFIRWSLSHWMALGIVAAAAGALLWGCRRLRMEKRVLIGKVLGAVFLLTFLIETFGRRLLRRAGRQHPGADYAHAV